MSDQKNTQPMIFIIEDETKMREILRINLSRMYNVFFYSDAEGALRDLYKKNPELIVTDVRLPGMDGIEFMEKIRKTNRDIPFIVFTGYGSIDHAVDTMKRGAFDYLVKPIKIDDLTRSIDRALSYIEVSRSTLKLEDEYRVIINDMESEFITRDPATIQMLNLVQKAAQLHSPILIIGDTGTGKELIAHYIHEKSKLEGPFVELNCASIPKELLDGELFGYKKGAFTGAVQDYEGKIALSDRGTLFLDEIGELPFEVQAKLLRVLEIPEYYPLGSNVKKRIDLNLVSATNRNLRRMVDEGIFRNDLYYRVAVIPVTLPLLRERKCDILPLVNYFLEEKNTDYIISPEAKLRLLEYNWPGNVRELKNVIERSILLAENGNVINKIIFDMDNYTSSVYESDFIPDDLPDTWGDFKAYKSSVLGEKKEELEKLFIEKLLIKNNGNVSVCSRSAGIDRRQLQDMIKFLNIDVSLFKSSKQ